MALIVEDGNGLANAESFASVAEADEHHAKRGNAAWAALTVEVKEQLLIKATDYVENVFGQAWIGTSSTISQALSWPRYRAPVPGSSRYYLGVPKALKEATIELALMASVTPLMPTMQTRGKKRVKLGSMEVEYDGNGPMAPSFLAATGKLKALLGVSGSGVMARLSRA